MAFGTTGITGNRGIPTIGGSQSLGMGAQGGLPDIDPTTINALLQHFGGMSIPDQATPQGPFETGWLGSHLGGLGSHLDNALITLANMGPTGPTAGDNISNVARGLSAIGPTRNAQAAAQYQVPLQMAGEVAKLQEAQHHMSQMDAMGGYYSGRNDAAIQQAQLRGDAQRDAAYMRAQANQQGHAMAAAKEPMVMTGPDGKKAVGFPAWNEDTQQMEYRPDKNVDPDAFQAQKNKSQLHGLLGNSLEGMAMLGTHGMPPDMTDLYGAKNSKWWAGVHASMNSDKAQNPLIGQAGANKRQDVGDWNHTSDEMFKQFLGDHGKGAQDRIKTRAMQLMDDPKNANADLATLKQQAQAEEDSRTQKVMSTYGQYKLLPEDGPPGTMTQKSVQGPTGYFQRQGYDPQTRDFTGKSQGNAMGAGVGVTQQNAPGAGLGANPYDSMSPAEKAYVDAMRKH